jgi:hypothetical protein
MLGSRQTPVPGLPLTGDDYSNFAPVSFTSFSYLS